MTSLDTWARTEQTLPNKSTDIFYTCDKTADAFESHWSHFKWDSKND